MGSSLIIRDGCRRTLASAAEWVLGVGGVGSFAFSPINPNSLGEERGKDGGLHCIVVPSEGTWGKLRGSRCFVHPSLPNHLPALPHCKILCLPSPVVACHGSQGITTAPLPVSSFFFFFFFLCVCVCAQKLISFLIPLFNLYVYIPKYHVRMPRKGSHLHFWDEKQLTVAPIAVCFTTLLLILEIPLL